MRRQKSEQRGLHLPYTVVNLSSQGKTTSDIKRLHHLTKEDAPPRRKNERGPGTALYKQRVLLRLRTGSEAIPFLCHAPPLPRARARGPLSLSAGSHLMVAKAL